MKLILNNIYVADFHQFGSLNNDYQITEKNILSDFQLSLQSLLIIGRKKKLNTFKNKGFKINNVFEEIRTALMATIIDDNFRRP